MNVLRHPDPRLRAATVEVDSITNDIRELAHGLARTMHALNVAGISAIQVGRPERLFLIDGKIAAGRADADPEVFINPEIVESNPEILRVEEGCSSVPDLYVGVARPRSVKVRARGLDGRWFEVEAEGMYGRAIQHELDHLNGRLIIDRDRQTP